MRILRTFFLCCSLMPLVAVGQNTPDVDGANTGAGSHAQTSSRQAPYPYAFRGDKGPATSAPIEIAIDYSYLGANESPGQCGCFALNGGSAETAFHLYRWFSAVADLTGERSGDVNNGSQGLSLVTFTAGPRATYRVGHYAPFAQALFGGAHGFDSYFPVTGKSTGAASGLAMIAGGGLDIRTNSHLAIRAVQADYLYTQLPNGTDNRQNNLRLSAGLVLRLW